ncbi:MAG: pyrroline-5-carboxylate reductase [Peptococcaceae bacterium]|nr:pyrroline-5-carboxylate reductase [Peptococcaceae bacterium]MDH7524573.1 pyrroline-5-carboxylate reductase [Peptococcaceae bacterium]
MAARIGVIGTGSLGSTLVRGFVNGKAAKAGEINILNRTQAKAQKLAEELPGVNLFRDYRELVKESEIIFLCVKPGDLKAVLEKTGYSFDEGKIVVSTLLAPPLSDLERIIDGKLARIYPSVTQSTGRGVTLLTWGQKVQAGDKSKLIPYLAVLGKYYELPEKYYRAAGDVTSCGPAFMACMVGALAAEAVRRGIPRQAADEIALETMLGTALLMKEKGLDFEGLARQVATPGGCTAEGLKVLQKGLPPLVEEVYEATCRRENEIILGLRKVFSDRLDSK